jgi:hypothetical protein
MFREADKGAMAQTGRKIMKSVIKQSLAAAAIVVAGVFPAKAAEYVMSASADYSGPFADVMPSAMSGIQAVVNWWNKEVG